MKIVKSDYKVSEAVDNISTLTLPVKFTSDDDKIVYSERQFSISFNVLVPGEVEKAQAEVERQLNAATPGIQAIETVQGAIN